MLTELGLSVPGLGLATRYLTDGVSAVVQRSQQARMLSEGVDLQADNAEAVGAVTQSLLRFTRADLPAILVIEDMHLIGPDGAQLVESLLGQVSSGDAGTPLLIIGTCWPAERHSAAFTDLLATIPADRQIVHEIAALELAARVDLVLHHAERTSPEVLSNDR